MKARESKKHDKSIAEAQHCFKNNSVQQTSSYEREGGGEEVGRGEEGVGRGGGGNFLIRGELSSKILS